MLPDIWVEPWRMRVESGLEREVFGASLKGTYDDDRHLPLKKKEVGKEGQVENLLRSKDKKTGQVFFLVARAIYAHISLWMCSTTG